MALEVAQAKFFRKQRQVLDAHPDDEAAFHASLEISARALAEYVLYRDWIVRKLAQTPATAREDVVHELIAPQRRTFEQGGLTDDLYRNNAWLLDDKFMTFKTILSESEMTEVIRAISFDDEGPEDDGRPDISLIFSADPQGPDKVDVVMVELKRRQINDKEGTYATVQLLKRARMLIDFCPNIQRVWYYAIVELDDRLERLFRDMEFVPLFSRGKVLFRDYRLERTSDGVRVPTPTFVMSFEAIVADAQSRNHAFLELLKSRFRERAKVLAEAAAKPSVEP
jgi:hypothetical protein